MKNMHSLKKKYFSIAILIMATIFSIYNIFNYNTKPASATATIYVTGVDTSHTDGTFNTGEIIDIVLTYNQQIQVDTSGGVPTISLNSGGSAIYYSYNNFTIIFRYTVGLGDSSPDLTYNSTGSLSLNGGKITKNNTPEFSVDLTLPNPTVFQNAHAITINTTPKTFTLTYTANANGSITGTSPQTVDQGSDGSGVTATPDAGYHFTSWSDGITTASRTDTNIQHDITVSASFAADEVNDTTSSTTSTTSTTTTTLRQEEEDNTTTTTTTTTSSTTTTTIQSNTGWVGGSSGGSSRQGQVLGATTQNSDGLDQLLEVLKRLILEFQRINGCIPQKWAEYFIDKTILNICSDATPTTTTTSVSNLPNEIEELEEQIDEKQIDEEKLPELTADIGSIIKTPCLNNHIICIIISAILIILIVGLKARLSNKK